MAWLHLTHPVPIFLRNSTPTQGSRRKATDRAAESGAESDGLPECRCGNHEANRRAPTEGFTWLTSREVMILHPRFRGRRKNRAPDGRLIHRKKEAPEGAPNADTAGHGSSESR